LSFAPVHHNRGKLIVKRGIDIVGSAILLTLVAPILGVATLAIRLTSPGPIFFRQTRCGLNGRQFVMLKLRTMYVDAEQRKAELMHLNEMTGPVFKMKNDPRITPVGRIFRRLSIDELPQLWDVLRGDMSLVGPRPAVPLEVDEYATFERRRLSMRPGLTCIWQVNGRNDIGFDDWVRLDLEYIDTWNLTNDFKILAQTLPAVLGGEGAS
jgi:lipopolysaccharide/colanic/teichoic acid biosynthesis glycosyltransferase